MLIPIAPLPAVKSDSESLNRQFEAYKFQRMRLVIHKAIDCQYDVDSGLASFEQ